MIRSLLAFAAVAAALTPAAARAADAAKPDDKAAASAPKPNDTKAEDFQRVDERQPRTGTPLIADKLYPMQFRLELSGVFDYSFNDKYVQHTGGHGALAFHLFDWLALEGFGGYLIGDETGIVGNVRNDGSSAKRLRDGEPCFDGEPTCEPQLPDMWMTTWFAGADVQWAPIYGKISAVSEYDLNFQLYALAGAGA
jgi:outer membrane beta-barrel protein